VGGSCENGNELLGSIKGGESASEGLCSMEFVSIYGCERWPFFLREEHRLRGFEDRVPRKIFWPKRKGKIA